MQEIFVTIPPLLRPLLIKELKELGVPNIRPSAAGVFVPKDMRWVYLINYCSRLATRVLWPITRFPCRNRDDLYHGAYKIFWPEIFSQKKSFAIDANVISQNLRHSLFAAQVMKDALCDRFRKECGERPSVSLDSPDIQLNLFVADNMATISFDTSGQPLYKRGWRAQTGPAPLQESLAAAVLTLCDYTSETTLCDPFCGSGTLLIEAAMMATRTPPNYFRKHFGFFHLPFFDEQAWQKVKESANSKRIPLAPGRIFGADKDPKAIAMCQQNLQNAELGGLIEVTTKDVRSYFPAEAPQVIITNPPYGKRLQSSAEIYQALGYFLKTKCAKDHHAFLLCPEQQLVASTGFPLKQETPLVSGGLDLRLFQL